MEYQIKVEKLNHNIRRASEAKQTEISQACIVEINLTWSRRGILGPGGLGLTVRLSKLANTRKETRVALFGGHRHRRHLGLNPRLRPRPHLISVHAAVGDVVKTLPLHCIITALLPIFKSQKRTGLNRQIRD